jgi:hypothetical protein
MREVALQAVRATFARAAFYFFYCYFAACLLHSLRAERKTMAWSLLPMMWWTDGG